jgi:hypothetical protein
MAVYTFKKCGEPNFLTPQAFCTTREIMVWPLIITPYSPKFVNEGFFAIAYQMYYVVFLYYKRKSSLMVFSSYYACVMRQGVLATILITIFIIIDQFV